MKKLALVLLLFVSVTLSAQTKYSWGMMFNPQGKILLNEADKGFSLVYPLYLLGTITRGELSFSPMFCLNDNSFGGFLSWDFTPKSNSYFVASKSANTRDVYLGIGAGTKVSNNSSIFLEFGTLAQKWEPQVYLGVSIPFIWEKK